MRLDQPGQPVIDLLPHFARHHCFQRRVRNLDAEVARALMAGVDDPCFSVFVRAHQKMGDRVDRRLGGREADAQQSVFAQSRQTFERQAQMGAALVGGDGVDFIDDHRARGRQHLAAGLRAEQHV